MGEIASEVQKQGCETRNMHAVRPLLLVLALLLAALSIALVPGCSSSDSDPEASAENVQSQDAVSSGAVPAVKADEDAQDAIPAVRVEEETKSAIPAVPYIDESDSKQGKQAQQGGQAPQDGQAQPAQQSSQQQSQEGQTSAVPEGSGMLVRFIDVGQGDCTLISSGGRHMLIDGGPASASSKVYSVLKDLGVASLDAVVATHPDADHVGGLSGALEAASCGTFYCSTDTSDTKTWKSLVSRLGSQGVGVTIPESGDTLSLGDATVTFVGPVRRDSTENNNSLVLRVDHGECSFLFTGDAESSEESSIVASGANVDVDVLKVGHHGSANSSTAGFLAKVTPAHAVISVGRNSYGHPTSAAISRLEKAGSKIYRTDVEGSVIATSDGKDVRFEFTKGRIAK